MKNVREATISICCSEATSRPRMNTVRQGAKIDSGQLTGAQQTLVALVGRYF